MNIKTHVAKKRLAMAELRASHGEAGRINVKSLLKYPRHIVIVGPPGSAKTSLMHGILFQFPHDYEKAPSITNRNARQGETEDADYIFVAGDLSKNKEQKIIAGTQYLSGNTSYAVSYDQIRSIISRGKKFVTVTSVAGAEILKEIFEDGIFLVYIEANPMERSQRLHNKYQDCEGSEELIKEALRFGELEHQRFENTKTPFYIVKQKLPIVNVPKDASQAVASINLKYRDSAEDVVFAAERKVNLSVAVKK